VVYQMRFDTSGACRDVRLVTPHAEAAA
jgi:hypothetical protein